MADSVETVTSTDQEMAAPDTQKEQVPEEKVASDIEELKKAISDDTTKANNEIEEEEEYVLKDEAHEEEETQKEQENNGKESEEKPDEKDGKEAADAQKKDEALGSTVAKHYNSIPESGKEARRQSRIFYLRNFNNWVKSVLINEYLEKAKKVRRRYDEEINVLDLGCGKGGDLLKWQKGRVDHVICADIAETSVEQCKERYENMRKSQRQGGYRESRERLFSIECIPADCTKVNLLEKFRSKDMQLDLTSCQFAFHYSFESYKQADVMLRNACERLRPGGYFIGTTPDSYELVKRLKKAEGNSFGNEVYNIEFENKEEFGLFGAKYNFKLSDVVDCPEFLVYFPAVEKLAEKYNMKLVYKKNFRDLFAEKNKDFGNLMHKMQALEPYPARKGWSLVSDNEEDYSHVKKRAEESQSSREKDFGTLTKDEWEAAGLYMAFAFEKRDPEEDARREAAKEKAQKRAASSDKEDSSSAPPAKRVREVDTDKKEEDTDKKAEESTGESKPEEAAQESSETAKEPEDTEMTDVADTKEDATTEEKAEAATGGQEAETEGKPEVESAEDATTDDATTETPAEEQQVEETMEESKSVEEIAAE